MWDEPEVKTKEQKQRSFFIDWTQRIASEERMRRAEEALVRAEENVPEIRLYRTTPQSPPWHSEGPFVADHVKRILVGLFAITDGEDLLDVEELARNKHHRAELTEMQETIREHAGTLEAFALVHDIAKPTTLSFDAPSGSRGEAEGYRQIDRRDVSVASDRDRATYRKLLEAMAAQKPHLSRSELAAQFFDKYEIATHYYGHDRLGASDQFLAAREAVSDRYRIPDRDRALLTWMIRNHIDALAFFKGGANPEKFNLLLARADKQGLDADDALDLLLAAAFLDTAIGGVVYREGRFSVDLDVMWNFLGSEELAAEGRRGKRRERELLQKRKACRAMLQEVGLGAEEVFTLLDIPFGPERGEVIKKIKAALQDQGAAFDFPQRQDEVRARITEAQRRFDPEVMAWENADLV